MEVLGLIPARGNSKGLPGKNLRDLAGKPMIVYTFEAAKSCGVLNRILLSTDDEEIAELGRAHGIEVPFRRPLELVQDDTPMLPVVLHALQWLDQQEALRPEVVVLLQPTSPLRRAEHIRQAVALLIESGADSVVSVVKVPHHFNPVSVMLIQQGRLVPFLGGEGTRILRRQDKPVAYARNGAAVYAIRRSTLTEQHSLFGRDCRPLIMEEEDSFDVDSELDLMIVDALMRLRTFRQP